MVTTRARPSPIDGEPGTVPVLNPESVHEIEDDDSELIPEPANNSADNPSTQGTQETVHEEVLQAAPQPVNMTMEML